MSVPVEIQKLCEVVPWPPDEARVGPATEDQIRSAETVFGTEFPAQWREFLQYLNGPCIGPGGVLGVDAERSALDFGRVLDSYPTWRTKRWIPVGGDGCGNYYVLIVCEDGTAPVGFVDTISSPDEIAYVVASDLWHFLSSILKKELEETPWPFSREQVLRDDPNLETCTIAPMPWEA